MVDRFLDYFGLESMQAKTIRGNNYYAIATPAALENFPDIDECLKKRAEAAIELARKISLKEIADKVEATREANQRPLTKHQPNELEQWEKPENIAEVAEMLDSCEDAETLALIRLGSIPPNVFKIAARSLPQEKREQIKQWVCEQNAA